MTATHPHPLPLTLTVDVTRQLAFIRYVFGLGEKQATAPEPLAAAGLLMFQDSVELFLLLVAERLNIPTEKVEFLKYFTLIDSKIRPEALAESGTMGRLNKARVNLKHYSNPPPRSAVEGFRRSSRAFFEANTPKLFGLQFDQVSLSHLVEDAATRETLLEVDKRGSAGDLEPIAEGLAKALAFLFKAYGIDPRTEHRFPVNLDDRELRVVGEMLTDHDRELRELRRDVGLLRRGVDLRRLAVFRALTGDAVFMADGSLRIWGGGQKAATAVSVQFCYDFVIDTALQLQAEQRAIDEVWSERPGT